MRLGTGISCSGRSTLQRDENTRRDRIDTHGLRSDDLLSPCGLEAKIVVGYDGIRPRYGKQQYYL